MDKLSNLIPEIDINYGLIHASAGLEVFFHDRGGDCVILSFNEMGMIADGKNYWARTLAAKLGFSIVGFVTRSPNWFPLVDMNAAIPTVQKHLDGRYVTRITFGTSQGAYAAIKYSVALKATKVIAFSPQVSIVPGETDDNRFQKHYRPDLHEEMKITIKDIIEPQSIFVFFDPYDFGDAEHVKILRELAAIREFHVWFAGHRSIKPLAQTETMKLFLQYLATDDLSGLRRLVAINRRQIESRAYRMIMANLPQNAIRAEFLAKKYREELTASQIMAMLFRFVVAKKYDLVTRWANDLVLQHPDNVEILGGAAVIYLRANDPLRALESARRAIEIDGDGERFQWIFRAAEAMVKQSNFVCP